MCFVDFTCMVYFSVLWTLVEWYSSVCCGLQLCGIFQFGADLIFVVDILRCVLLT